MALSIADLIPRVRDRLAETGDQTWATTGSAASASSVVTVDNGADWEEGGIGEFQTTGESWKVISVSGNDLTCFRGWAGTTAAAATTQTVLRDPSFSVRQITTSLQAATDALWPLAYKTEVFPLTPDTTKSVYNLSNNALDVIGVTQLRGLVPDQPYFYGAIRKNRSKKLYQFSRGVPTSLVASGVGISFPRGLVHSTNTIYVTAMEAITGNADILDGAPLPVAECVIVGAMADLMRQHQVKRIVYGVNVPVSAQLSSTAALQVEAAWQHEFNTMLAQLNYQMDAYYDPDRKHV